jgi:hypothetical protein
MLFFPRCFGGVMSWPLPRIRVRWFMLVPGCVSVLRLLPGAPLSSLSDFSGFGLLSVGQQCLQCVGFCVRFPGVAVGFLFLFSFLAWRVCWAFSLCDPRIVCLYSFLNDGQNSCHVFKKKTPAQLEANEIIHSLVQE